MAALRAALSERNSRLKQAKSELMKVQALLQERDSGMQVQHLQHSFSFASDLMHIEYSKLSMRAAYLLSSSSRLSWVDLPKSCLGFAHQWANASLTHHARQNEGKAR